MISVPSNSLNRDDVPTERLQEMKSVRGHWMPGKSTCSHFSSSSGSTPRCLTLYLQRQTVSQLPYDADQRNSLCAKKGSFHFKISNTGVRSITLMQVTNSNWQARYICCFCRDRGCPGTSMVMLLMSTVTWGTYVLQLWWGSGRPGLELCTDSHGDL